MMATCKALPESHLLYSVSRQGDTKEEAFANLLSFILTYEVQRAEKCENLECDGRNHNCVTTLTHKSYLLIEANTRYYPFRLSDRELKIKWLAKLEVAEEDRLTFESRCICAGD